MAQIRNPYTGLPDGEDQPLDMPLDPNSQPIDYPVDPGMGKRVPEGPGQLGGPDYKQMLKDYGGDLYGEDDYNGFLKNQSYAQNAGKDPMDFIRSIESNYDTRRNSHGGAHSDDSGSTLAEPNVPNGQASGDQNSHSDEIFKQLQGLFPGGGFNQGVVNSRVSNARDTMNRQRESSKATNQASLASRGLIGSGPEQTAQNRLDTRMDENFNSAVNDIYANEGQAADSRMMDALRLATGLSSNQDNNALGYYNADISKLLGEGQLDLGRTNAKNNFALGQGQLALGNVNAQNNYNLGLGQLDLGQQQLQHAIETGDWDTVIRLLQVQSQNAQTSANGYF